MNLRITVILGEEAKEKIYNESSVFYDIENKKIDSIAKSEASRLITEAMQLCNNKVVSPEVIIATSEMLDKCKDQIIALLKDAK